MANELVKWKPSPASRKIEAALEKIRGSARPVARPVPAVEIELVAFADIVDVPRICTVVRRPYVARYVLSGGHFRYAQGIRHIQGLNAVKYESGVAATISWNDIGEEMCPWCHAVGWGAIRCGECTAFVCYGRTVGDWFKCCCGNEGRLVQRNTDESGFVPRSADGNGR